MKTLFTFLLLISYSFLFAQIQVSTLVDNIDASGGVKVDAEGNIIVADFGESLDNANGNSVWTISPEGEVSLFASGLSGASGNAFNSEGHLFQSNISSGVVSEITPNGTVSTFSSVGISCNVGIVTDPVDNLYVCNCCGTFGNTIRKITPAGVSTNFASGSLFNCPNGITIDSDDNLYVSNFSNGSIIKITPEGTKSLFASTPAAAGSTASNGHIVYSPQENVLYVASHGSHRIYRLDLAGNLEVVAGTSARGNLDGPALEATFSRPNGVALSQTGDTLYLNSSIPTTNAGGRPLNPSKIRMLTGLLDATATNEPVPAVTLLKVFPNPSNGIMEISFQENHAAVSLNLLNSAGELVEQLQQATTVFSEQTLSFNFENLPKGIYYLQIVTENRVALQKVVFQ